MSKLSYAHHNITCQHRWQAQRSTVPDTYSAYCLTSTLNGTATMTNEGKQAQPIVTMLFLLIRLQRQVTYLRQTVTDKHVTCGIA